MQREDDFGVGVVITSTILGSIVGAIIGLVAGFVNGGSLVTASLTGAKIGAGIMLAYFVIEQGSKAAKAIDDKLPNIPVYCYKIPWQV